MNNWKNFTFHWDDAPLDISPMFAAEVPAGKHGFLKADGDKFVFEDGEQAKFWGVLLNSSACFPSHENADKVARRLAKFGINLVRLHQFDAVWATPNIFQFSKGTLHNTTRKLAPESLDRFDYLISALKKEGIYIYMDLMIYRTFKADDGLKYGADLLCKGIDHAEINRLIFDCKSLKEIKGAVLGCNDLLPVPLVNVNRVEVVKILVTADSVHIGIYALTRRKTVFFQRESLPLCERMHDLCVSVDPFYIERHRSFNSVQIIVQSRRRAYVQRS